jgi:hypothetical protein
VESQREAVELPDSHLRYGAVMSRWFQDRRQEFIAATLKTFGQIRREDLMREFDISMPKASEDIREFMQLNPAFMIYDVSAKCYVINEKANET